MLTRTEWQQAREWAWRFVQQAGIPLVKEEFANLDVAELGLGELEATGGQILTLASTEWVGAKLLILRPHQFFPQHRHPPSAQERYPGKTEVLRGQFGKAFLYMPGKPTPNPLASPPAHRLQYCTVWHQVLIYPGCQHVCPPDTWHWFQAAETGAVIWSISSRVTDAADQFLDPQVVRISKIIDN
jgi:D-lyxose ketol-isomerase